MDYGDGLASLPVLPHCSRPPAQAGRRTYGRGGAGAGRAGHGINTNASNGSSSAQRVLVGSQPRSPCATAALFPAKASSSYEVGAGPPYSWSLASASAWLPGAASQATAWVSTAAGWGG